MTGGRDIHSIEKLNSLCDLNSPSPYSIPQEEMSLGSRPTPDKCRGTSHFPRSSERRSAKIEAFGRIERVVSKTVPRQGDAALKSSVVDVLID